MSYNITIEELANLSFDHPLLHNLQKSEEKKNFSNCKNFIETEDKIHFETLHELQSNQHLFKKREVLNYLHSLMSNNKSEKPIFLTDLSMLVSQHLNWIKNLPIVRPFYAVKCNNDEHIVKTLKRLGCGFDCASKVEIKQILDLGVAPNKIIFANPIKPDSHLKFAFENGVDLMTFDNADELEKIQKHHKNAKLIIRIRVDDSKSICQFGAKFGVSSGKTIPLIEKISNLNMNLVGVSFHVGSGCGDPNAYYEAIKKAREVFEEAEEYGFKLTLLDIGGGFPGHKDGAINFEHHAKIISDSIKFFFSDLNIEIIAEPGRYYASSSMILATNITGRRVIHNEDSNKDENKSNEHKSEENIVKTKSFMYYISDGTYGSLNCVLYDHWELKDLDQIKFYVWDSYSEDYFIISKEDLNLKKKYLSTIWGPTCDSMDCIVKNLPIPELKIGDWIVFENAGAYTIAAGCEFNGFPRPEIYYLNTRISDYLERCLYEYYNKEK